MDPDDVSTHIQMGEELSEMGRSAEAADAFAKAADRLYEFGRLKEFTKVSERYSFHRSEDGARLKRLVEVYLQRGDPKRALAKLELLFKAAPKDAEGLELLVRAFRDVGRPENAVNVLKELANLYRLQGKEENSVSCYRRILELSPGDPDALAQMGIANAVEEEELPELVPIEVQAMSDPVEQRSALSREELGETSGVRWRRLKSVTRLFSLPSGIVTCNSELDRVEADELARLLVEIDGYAKVGLYDPANDSIRTLLKKDPLNVSARERAAFIAQQRGRIEDAVANLLFVTKLVWKPDPVRAAAYLKQAIALAPGHPDVVSMRSELGLDGVNLDTFMIENSPEDVEIDEFDVDEIDIVELDADDPFEEEAPQSSWDKMNTPHVDVLVTEFEEQLFADAAPLDEFQDELGEDLAIEIVDDDGDFEFDSELMDLDEEEEEDGGDWVPFAPAADAGSGVRSLNSGVPGGTGGIEDRGIDSEPIWIEDQEDDLEDLFLEDVDDNERDTMAFAAVPIELGAQQPALQLPPLPAGLPPAMIAELDRLAALAAQGQSQDVQALLFELMGQFPEYTPLIMERMQDIEQAIG
ncbi:MAG: hypothetical protein KC561_04450 [Myxococcales bacterium]|nr:hypothetical protein [Myxococcales bacterium]